MWRSIRFKLVVVYLLLILFSMQLIGAYFVRTLTQSLIQSQTENVENQAQLIATIALPEVLNRAKPTPVQHSSLLGSFPQFFNGVVYVLNKDGVVKDTTAGTALIGQKRTDSVATQTLLSHHRAVAIHLDPITDQHLLAVATPIMNGSAFEGIVECVVPIQTTYSTVRQVTTIFYTGSALVLLLTGVLGIILASTITRPVLDVTGQARKMAAGDFTQRVEVHGDDEFGDLSKAVNDLTDKLEDAIAQNEHERERLQAVIKYMGDGILAFDQSMKPIFSNDVAQRLLPSGTPLRATAEAIGLTSDILERPETDHAYIKEMGDALLHVHVSSIYKNKQVEGYVAILRDVTEQEKLQAARRDFVANVSHELRTPLTSIKSYIEALLYSDEDVETRSKFLDVIAQETDRMVRLTQDLLQLTGLEMKTDHFQVKAIGLKGWLHQALKRFELQAKSQGVELTLRSPKRGTIQGDRDMLDRLIDNLIGNALKYTADGGRIVISTTMLPNKVQLSIADTGVGIPKEDLPHVFERFYRVDKARSRRKGGTGLGLAIAREITEWHGGKIYIDSTVDRGTTVTVHLPSAEEETSDDAE